MKIAKLEIQSQKIEEVARYALRQLSGIYPSRLIVVEDSGLFIRALSDFPGSFSSYVRESLGLEGILKLMEGHRERSAFFKAALAVAGPGTDTRIFADKVHGNITNQIRGNHGFGFDPIFIPTGQKKTFAQMTQQSKNKYSHRARALRKLAVWYDDRF